MSDPRYRALPAVQRILSEAALSGSSLPRWCQLEGAREALNQAREAIAAGREAPSLEGITADALARAHTLARPSLRAVINAAGVVVHTNLGRAPLSEGALAHVVAVGRGYCNLEYDIEAGRRGSRRVHARDALIRLTGAEDALIVNNNAAAVLLVVSALARDREVIVSRGELVEIGGSFRIPDILAAGGARLREVGTTNRTRAADYEDAIGPETGLLMKVHPSNFTVSGFTESVDRKTLGEIGRRRGIPVVEDLGSGRLGGAAGGLAPGQTEPDLKEALASGVDLITLSGDKLIGGPQAGILLGRRALIAALARHPMARALRVGKLTLAALEATLASYLRGDEAREIPVPRALAKTESELEAEARTLRAAVLAGAPGVEASFEIALVAGEGRSGGGSLPGVPLPTTLVALTPRRGGEAAWAQALRRGEPAVLCRVREGMLLFDPRALLPGDDARVAQALARALEEAATST